MATTRDISGNFPENAGGGDMHLPTPQEQRLLLVDGIAAPAASVGYTKLYTDVADGDLKVIFGDGIVKTLATDV